MGQNTESKRRITKIKLNGSTTEVFYDAHAYRGDGSTTNETKVSSTEPRDPAFTDAMAELADDVIKLLELPQDWKNGMEVRGISLSDNDTQGQGAVITVLKSLANVNSPLVINTPHLHEGTEHDETTSVMSARMYQNVIRLIGFAEAFVDGQRAQEELPLGISQ